MDDCRRLVVDRATRMTSACFRAPLDIAEDNRFLLLEACIHHCHLALPALKLLAAAAAALCKARGMRIKLVRLQIKSQIYVQT